MHLCLESFSFVCMFSPLLFTSSGCVEINLFDTFIKVAQDVSQRVRLTWDDTSLLTIFHGFKIVVIPTAASVFKQLASSRVNVKEESILDGLAGPWLILQGAQLVEDTELSWCSICRGRRKRQVWVLRFFWRLLKRIPWVCVCVWREIRSQHQTLTPGFEIRWSCMAV